MSDRFGAAFVFGSLGNLAGALGDGWSVEDHYCWAVGDRSGLLLPLPDDDQAYMLRLTVHPLVHPGIRDSQRLTVTAGGLQLGDFELVERATIELPLPLALTRFRSRLDLTLIHPDAVRPLDFKDSPDARWLTLCFHSGGLVRATQARGGSHVAGSSVEREGTAGEGADAEGADLVHAVVAGHHVARQIVAVMSKLSLLRDRIRFHHVAPDDSLAAAISGLPPGVLQAARIYWRQSGVGTPEVAAALRDGVPADCDVQRIPFPCMTALWPLQGADSRRIAEPGQYPSGRYQFSDRIGASMANMMLPDDVVLLAYESMAEKEMPDLDRSLAADLAGWRQLDAANDIQVADFIHDNFRRQRLFMAPSLPAAPLLRHIIDQLIATPSISAVAEPTALARELDFLMAGYVAHWQELPIHPHIARHFGLQWWQPGMLYRWFGNAWTFEEYALHYIRWQPWRP